MKRTIAVIALVLALVAGSYIVYSVLNKQSHTTKPQTTRVAQEKLTEVIPPTVDELHRLTNEERVKAGLQPIPLDSRLNASAQRKADDETKYNYFGHINPVTGERGAEYAHEAVPECVRTGENLTDGTDVNDAKHAVDAWMRSPGHRDAILRNTNVSMGFGISGIHIVQHFCLSQ